MIVLLTPLFIYGIIASGCPLFPSTFGCLDLPWRLPTETATAEALVVQGLSAETATSSLQNHLDWWWGWLQSSRKSEIMAIAFLTTIVYTFWRLIRINQSSKGELFLLLLGCLGTTFILLKGPWLRFGLGYFVLIPAWIITKYSQAKLEKNNLKFGFQNSWQWSKLLLVAPFLASLVTIISFEDYSSLFLPPELPKPNVIVDQVNDVKYSYPDNWAVRCWAIELPCAEVPRENIKLRKPSQGIESGFVVAK